jgi:hypothetical protein
MLEESPAKGFAEVPVLDVRLDVPLEEAAEDP